MKKHSDFYREYLLLLQEQIAQMEQANAKSANSMVIKRGLRNLDGTGVLAGITGIGSVQGYSMLDGERIPMPGQLYYRGIDVESIIAAHQAAGTFSYEEVVYLLLMGKLPTKAQFAQFQQMLAETRALPTGFQEDVIFKAPSANIMNQIAKGVIGLYAYDSNPDDISPENLMRQSIEIVARMPAIVANSYAIMKYYIQGKSLHIHNPKPELSAAENFLRMARADKEYDDAEAKLLDLMLTIHAEHGGGNNSTFVCRAVSSTGTDTYSAIAAAVGSLKGPLHGGANAKVMEMFRFVKQDVGDAPSDEALQAYLGQLLDGTAGDHSGKIYGIGHAVYTLSDPRAEAIRTYARTVAGQKGRLADLELLESIARIGTKLVAERKGLDVPICANVDLYSGLVYDMLNIPSELFTPLFALARTAGWCAHRMEEALTAHRIMRPAYRALKINQPYVPIDDR
ncbi:MAG: citrate synthase [Oscillospiraceae bacterium]|nr:citrate synthase [Oscillospiraceae bacterium]